MKRCRLREVSNLRQERRHAQGFFKGVVDDPNARAQPSLGREGPRAPPLRQYHHGSLFMFQRAHLVQEIQKGLPAVGVRLRGRSGCRDHHHNYNHGETMKEKPKPPRCESRGCPVGGGIKGYCATHYARKFLPRVTGSVPCYRVSSSIAATPRVVWRGMLPVSEALQEVRAEFSRLYIDMGR